MSFGQQQMKPETRQLFTQPLRIVVGRKNLTDDFHGWRRNSGLVSPLLSALSRERAGGSGGTPKKFKGE